MANLNRLTTTYTSNGQTGNSTNADYVRTFVFDVSGTFVATLQVQVSVDGSTWRNVTGSVSVYNVATGAFASGGNITAAGLYAVDISEASSVRLITTAYTSGSAVVASLVSDDGNLITGAVTSSPSGTQTVTGTVTANQGTLASGSSISLTTAASTNATSSKTTAGNLFEVSVSNVTATAAYVKFYNKATAPTVGTDVPVLTIPAPANSTVAYQFGSQGKRFATGIAFAVTGAITAADTTAAPALVQVNGTYI